ncbi:unnamed protein product [Adineta steineri]|uniref:Uncharacterized protein n=1 Tax=Adineta steineri TaxID=433720 RepID=A0A818RVN0_9BILA|nr:unnamed protein product [Adineta steineri]CAF3659999.1 unnamed protein product [Adineta steineri]
MATISPDATIAIIVVAVVVVVIIVIVVICCLCRKCDQCARWSRGKAMAREEAQQEQQRAEMQRGHDQTRIERETVRDQIRAKYNLNGGKPNVAVLS